MSSDVASSIIGVAILEIGVLLHSFVIGLTLATVGKFLTLFIVITLHRESASLAACTSGAHVLTQ
jgi:zinc transporter 1/2/3